MLRAMLQVAMVLLVACECTSSQPHDDPASPADPNDVRWDEVGRQVGAEVPTPGSAPAFQPVAERSSETVRLPPRVLASRPYGLIVPGEPRLAVRHDMEYAPSGQQIFTDTLVALEDTPRDLMSLQHTLRHVVRDDEHAWCAGEGGLSRVDIQHGGSEQIEAAPVHAVALGDSHVYWVTGGDARPGEPPSTLHRMPKAGGEAETLFEGLPFITGLGLQGDRVYWVARMRPRRLMDMPPGYFATAAANGSGEPTVETFESQRPTEIVVDDQAVYILTEGTLGPSLSTSFRDGLVLRRAHGSSQWQALADGQITPSSLVQDDHRLCWVCSDGEGFDIRCVAKTGGPVLNVARVTMIMPHLGLHGGLLTWTDEDNDRVMAVPIVQIGETR